MVNFTAPPLHSLVAPRADLEVCERILVPFQCPELNSGFPPHRLVTILTVLFNTLLKKNGKSKTIAENLQLHIFMLLVPFVSLMYSESPAQIGQ